MGRTRRKGTKVTFWPDDAVFETTNFHYDMIARRLRDLSFLNRGVHIVFTDERIKGDKKDQTVEYYSEGGLMDFVKFLNQDRDKTQCNRHHHSDSMHRNTDFAQWHE